MNQGFIKELVGIRYYLIRIILYVSVMNYFLGLLPFFQIILKADRLVMVLTLDGIGKKVRVILIEEE